MKLHKKVLILLFLILIIGFYLDKYILDLVLKIRAPILNLVFILVAVYLNYYVLAAVITLLPFLKKNRKVLLIKFWSTFLVSAFFVYILKLLIARQRPLISLINELDYSFPSGHTTIMFALYPLISENFKEYKYIWLIISIIIAFSRLHLGVHYFTDIIFGVIFGLIMGYGMKSILNKKWIQK